LKSNDKLLIRNYEGFYLDDIPTFSVFFECSVFLYNYDKLTDKYFLNRESSIIDVNYELSFHVLYITNDDKSQSHFLYVSNPDKLINGKVCPHCGSQWFDTKDKNRHFSGDYEKHVSQCKLNDGKIY
jgi:hypothetical protein